MMMEVILCLKIRILNININLFYFTYVEIWLESICEVPAEENDIHNNKVISNGSVPHKKPEKQDTICTEIPNKKIVTNDKLM